MTKTEIVVLIITILVSVSVLSLFLDKLFKVKKEKPQEEKKEQTQEVKEETTEEKPKEKEKTKKYKAPAVSIALQDELNEFKDYLKTRITPETVSKEDRIRNSYDMPRINRDFDKFNLPPRFMDDDEEFPFRKKQKTTSYDDLSDEIKILLFTNFFDTKF